MRHNPPPVEQYIQGITNGDIVTLSRAITLIESQRESDREAASQLIRTVLPKTGNSFRIGISGVPGVGKSTFIEAFGKHITSLKKKIAVLAVDPASAKTKGSILGDKTRMEELSRDPLAYIRPTSSGLHLGGVGGKTREAILLCEAAGFEIIVVETVGVGQSETAVRGMVDFFLLLMLAGAGDELQGIKKGIIELADAIVINKADGDNLKKVKQAQADLQHAFHLFTPGESTWKTKILACSALMRQGIGEIWALMEEFKTFGEVQGNFLANRKRQNQIWMEEAFAEMVRLEFFNPADLQRHQQEFLQLVSDQLMLPQEAARLLFNEFLKKLKTK